MGGVVLDQKRAYRRGMLLGFTMAEIVIMLLFCILLAMAFVVDRQEVQLEDARVELEASKKEVAELTEVKEAVSIVLGALPSDAKRDSFFLELRRAKDSADELRWLRESLGDPAKGSKALEPIRTAIAVGRSQGLTEEQVISRLIADYEYGQAVRQGLQSSPLSSEPPGQVAALARLHEETPPDVRECQSLRTEKERLRGQVANIQARLSRFGRGTEMPACWADAETGKPEYIFHVELTPGGMVTRDLAVPHRASEQATLPISAITFGVPVSREAFRAQTAAIADWSRANNCRFFVTVRDLTEARDKESYKRMLRAVEEHFYKFESN